MHRWIMYFLPGPSGAAPGRRRHRDRGAAGLTLALVVVVVALVVVGGCAATRPPFQRDECPVEVPAVVALPPAGPAPTNTRPLVFIDSGRSRLDPSSIALVTGEQDVPAEQRILRAEALTVVELRPTPALLPGTRYEIRGKERDQSASIGAFVTTDGADARTPRWSGKVTAVAVTAPARPSSCHTGAPYALLELEPAEGKPTEVVYGVWIPREGERLSSDSPTFFLRAWEGKRLILGGGLSPFPSNVKLPPGGSLRLILAAFDTAGNHSVPIELTLDLSAPQPEHPRWTDAWRVPLARLEYLRRKGDPSIPMPSWAEDALREAGFVGGTVTMELCVSERGEVDEVKMVYPRGVRADFVEHYRTKILGWRFWPFEVGGVPARVCSSVAYRYLFAR